MCRVQRMTTDFSIRRILSQNEQQRFEWLRCSRYKPPKLSRSKKKESRKRTSRTPRIPFTSGQLLALEQRFQKSPYLNTEEAAHLSSLLRLSELRVKVWFQNRRARERRLKGEILPVTNESKKSSQTKTGNWSAFHSVGPFTGGTAPKNVSAAPQKNLISNKSN